MALKDLVASRATLNEETIEAVVSDYVRYVVDHKEIALSNAGVGLAAKEKLFLKFVRNGRLVHEETDVAGKGVWIFERAK